MPIVLYDRDPRLVDELRAAWGDADPPVVCVESCELERLLPDVVVMRGDMYGIVRVPAMLDLLGWRPEGACQLVRNAITRHPARQRVAARAWRDAHAIACRDPNCAALSPDDHAPLGRHFTLPVGECVTLATWHADLPYLTYAPLDGDGAMECARGVFREWREALAGRTIVACPLLLQDAAWQMRAGYEHVVTAWAISAASSLPTSTLDTCDATRSDSNRDASDSDSSVDARPGSRHG